MREMPLCNMILRHFEEMPLATPSINGHVVVKHTIYKELVIMLSEVQVEDKYFLFLYYQLQ